MMKRTETERTCIVCRETQNCDGMIRFVVGPEQEIIPDLKRKLPGRGVWICGEKEHVAEAITKNGFARGFKLPVKADQSLLEMLDQMLLKSALSSLSLAKKAGEVVSGFTKVSSAIKNNKAMALLHTQDASQDGVRKVNQVLSQMQKEAALTKQGFDDCSQSDNPHKIEIYTLFKSNELETIIGVENVKHLALLYGGASQAFIKRINALVQYRGNASKG